MLFNSRAFILLFLPLSLVVYYGAINSRRVRHWVLISASLLFYGYCSPKFVIILLCSIVGNWLLAASFARQKRLYLPIAGVMLNLLLLGFYKYTNFLGASWAQLVHASFDPLPLLVPLGISFYTFQQISYQVDLRRGQAPLYSFTDYLLYILFFPKLIAGPIVRHHELIPQFQARPAQTEIYENLARGAALFLLGLFKKIIVADKVAVTATKLFGQADTVALNLGESWLAAYCYTLQIYYDFSGYSDMAIGLGLMYGFKLPINFNAPYIAGSIRDFWRRWHITLSSFLRDYLYIPLGGNRCGPIRQAGNVICTMLLCGLWHGASWGFIAWGMMHGLAMAANNLWRRYQLPMPRVLGWFFTLSFVIVAWVLFRTEDIGKAVDIWLAMLGRNGMGKTEVNHGGLLIAAGILALAGPTSDRLALTHLAPKRLTAIAGAALFVYLLFYLGGDLQHEFIYFKF